METKKIKSQFGTMKMYIRNGEIIVQGEGKISMIVGLFNIIDVEDILKECDALQERF